MPWELVVSSFKGVTLLLAKKFHTEIDVFFFLQDQKAIVLVQRNVSISKRKAIAIILRSSTLSARRPAAFAKVQ